MNEWIFMYYGRKTYYVFLYSIVLAFALQAQAFDFALSLSDASYGIANITDCDRLYKYSAILGYVGYVVVNDSGRPQLELEEVKDEETASNLAE